MERNKEQLRQMQNMPLDIKIQLTRDRIREWVRAFGVDGTYVSFSGGKDSTVLLHIAREMYPDIPAVFINTGLEYPEIKDFVKTWENIEWIRPKMGFKDVICKYGYPIFSKNISKMFWQASHGREAAIEYVNGTAKYKGEKSIYCCDRYKAVLNMDFTISHMCCDVMKKAPAHSYESKSGRKPIVGTLAEESKLRTQAWLSHGCNAFESRHQISMPLSFWTEQDILQYVKQNDIQICRLYGCIIERGGQQVLSGFECQYCLTGLTGTGCVFCAFGAHLEKEHRFLMMKESHPKLYDYCINGGAYDDNGVWKPNEKGLGMGHVFDQLNEAFGKNGKDFIPYK